MQSVRQKIFREQYRTKAVWDPELLPRLSFYCRIGQYIERGVVGTRNSEFIRKASKRRRWQTNVPKNHLNRGRLQASLIIKGKGLWLVVANFSVQESCVLAEVHTDLVTMFMLTSSKTIVTLFVPLNIRVLKRSYYVYFRLYANSFTKSGRSNMTKHSQQSVNSELKKYLTWRQVCSVTELVRSLQIMISKLVAIIVEFIN